MTLKRHNFFQNLNNRKATYSFAPGIPIFKLQQEVLRFNDICLSWSSQKDDQETNLLNSENQSFIYFFTSTKAHLLKTSIKRTQL